MMRRLLLCMPYVGPMAFEFLSLVAPIKLAVRLSTMSFGAIMTSCLRTTLRKDADSWRVSGEVRSVSIIVPLSCQDCSQRSPTTAFHVIQVHEGLLYIRMGMRIRDALTNNVALVKQYVKQETGRQNSRSTGKAINKVLSEISKKLTHVNDDKIQPSSLACFMSWAKHLDHQGKLADIVGKHLVPNPDDVDDESRRAHVVNKFIEQLRQTLLQVASDACDGQAKEFRRALQAAVEALTEHAIGQEGLNALLVAWATTQADTVRASRSDDWVFPDVSAWPEIWGTLAGLTAEAPKFFRDVMNPELGELHRPEQQRATALPSEPPADLNAAVYKAVGGEAMSVAPYWTALATWCFLTIPIPDPFLAIPPAAEDIDVGHDTQADANDGAPAADAPQGAAATEQLLDDVHTRASLPETKVNTPRSLMVIGVVMLKIITDFVVRLSIVPSFPVHMVKRQASRQGSLPAGQQVPT